MRWFRTHRTIGGRLALFALGLQLALSFGHIHREDIFGAARPTTVSAPTTAAASQSVPSNQPADRGDDYCQICATIALLSNSLMAAPPPLPVPFVSGRVEHIERATIAFAPLHRAQYQSRAPPVV
jgi:hypothetical protein